MEIQLNDEQLLAKDTILEFLADSTNNSIILQGMAGTGKTTIIKEVYNEWLQQEKLVQVVDPKYVCKYYWEFTATTNKAVQALTNATGLEATTIQSFLGLVVKGNGLCSTSRSQQKNDYIIVIDECSYIDYGLLEYIKRYCKKSKIIYMGDKTQLPPVGFNHSPVFYQEYPIINLTKQMRQLHSPNIAQYCRALQEHIINHTEFPTLSISNEIEHVSADEFKKLILKMDTTKSKILANKNTTVNKYNTMLFINIKGRDYFDIGDVVTNNHYVKGIQTDEDVVIRAITHNNYDYGYKGDSYFIKGKWYFMPKTRSATKKLVKYFIEQRDFEKAETVKNTWVDLRPSYALTIHKSQGSTYDEVYIDLNDFKTIKDLREMAKLLYVAMSRAKYKVIMTGDIR